MGIYSYVHATDHVSRVYRFVAVCIYSFCYM